MEKYLAIASGLWASVYGFGEYMCGDVGFPRACEVGATTASGEGFDPDLPTAALAAPADLRMEARDVWLRLDGGPHECRRIRINDKMHPRWIGVRGFDLTPAAVRRLGGVPTPKWGGRVHVCSGG